MRDVMRAGAALIATICVALPLGNDAFAGDDAKPTKKARVPMPGTITKTVNELGQTVYSIKASHFDISRPLLEMAREAAEAPGNAAEQENEPSMLPGSRILRSGVPDPVVQSAISPDSSGSVSLAAPTTGFNFAGVGQEFGWPSDNNGSVGNNQFVETVNSHYQVWSLNRATQVATPLLPGPANLSTLWSGFGGDCELSVNGDNRDPVVLFDKTAKRWLIAFVIASPPSGVYYECVAVSTGADATGTYARYAFALPNGDLGDYPKYGVWPPAAYYVTGLVYQSAAGGYIGGLFAAMDRTKMLAANPTATWLVIEDPAEFGHMPADVDGFALPPALAPGIFVSVHADGMYIYRMKVSFAGSGSASKTLQAIVPVAPSSPACGGTYLAACIPQPGSGTTVDSQSDRLMFRAAYRNFIDHESLVISHAVDPSVDGVVSGVRWYDIRLSGNPDATCPTYPCVYQQGTLADVPGGRSRWMSSLAMDGAENILLGYHATGQADGTDNHSIRYTGRAKADPPGLMTAPETVVATGTANITNSRWGDYASMSVDPFDDCTFWYVNQYYQTTDLWSTRIASAAFPAGSGAGQCPPTTCVTRPTAVPAIGTATTPNDNQITVTWTGITPTPGAYAIERAEGACGSEGLYRPFAVTAGTASSFTDTTVQGGIKYAYRVRAAADAAGKCQAQLTSGCAGTTATGTCNLKPSFSGGIAAASAQQGSCGVTVNWTPGASSCPLTPSLRYNIFRGATPHFVPSVVNRIASCVVGSSYLDSDNLQSGTTYYYVVRAEDSSTVNGGECGGGNEELNSVIVYGTPTGAGWQAAPGIWADGGGDGSASLTFGTTAGTSGPGWRFVETADDPGANHTPGGGYAYRNAGPTASDKYQTLCASMSTPTLTASATSLDLQYWERHQLEKNWDGVEVAYSVNGGPWTEVPAPSNSPAAGCDAADDTTDWGVLTCSAPNSGNANSCGIPPWEHDITGPVGDGSCTTRTLASPAANPYAHRCHPITGLTPGDAIQFRWRSSADPYNEFAGFYLDDLAVTNVRVPNVCAPDTCAGQADGTACSDGNACTSGDSCGGGHCVAGSSLTPVETTNMSAASNKVTYNWSAVALATAYDVVRGNLGALPVGPGGGDEICFDELASPTVVDTAVPAPATGYWYLSRGENGSCIGTFGARKTGTPRTTTTCP